MDLDEVKKILSVARTFKNYIQSDCLTYFAHKFVRKGYFLHTNYLKIVKLFSPTDKTHPNKLAYLGH